MFPKYLSEKEVAQIIGCTLSTLRNHRHLGRGLPYVKNGRSVRYNHDDVIGFMEGRKIQTTDSAALCECK